jgi:2-hydroxymuconate-semialdehyde hydrolase
MSPVPIGELDRIETPAGGTMMSSAVWGAPGATPVVLLHGIPTSAVLWRRLGPTLSAEGFRAFAPDLLGYGRSGEPTKGRYGLADQARYVHQFISSLGLRDIVLVGHDIGGGVAQLLAVSHPELVVGLVLVDTVVETNWPVLTVRAIGTRPFSYAGVPLDLALGFKRVLGWALRQTMRHPGRLTSPVLDAYASAFEGRGGTAQIARLARDLTSKDTQALSPRLAATAIPTLIIWGEHDTVLDPESGRTLAGALPDSDFVLVEDTGHLVPEESPFVLADAMLPFLRSRVPVRAERATGRLRRTSEPSKPETPDA